MRSILISIAPLLAGLTLLVMGNGMLSSLLALRMAQMDFPSWTTGLVMSSYFVGLVSGTFYAYRLISGVGHIRTFAALASCASAATLAHPFLVAAVPWAGLRFVEGFCISGLFMCTESWLHARATNETRGRILSLYMVLVYMSQGVGQFLLNLRDPSGFALFVIASILLSLALVPVAVTRVQAPDLSQPVRFGIGRLYATSPLGVAGCFAAGLMIGAFYGMGPFFAQQIGLDVAGTSQLMGFAILGGLILQWPFGRLSDRFDRRTVLTGLSGALVLTCVAMAAVAGGDPLWLLVLAPVFGGFVFTLYPLCAAHTNDYIEPSELVQASGGLILAYGVGAALGPLGASPVMEMAGPVGLFVFQAFVALLITAYALWRMFQRPPVPGDEQGEFRPLPRTTGVASELDPRGESADGEARGQGPGNGAGEGNRTPV